MSTRSAVYLAVFLFFAGSAGLRAQQTAQEPGLLLPPRLVEIEDPGPEFILSAPDYEYSLILPEVFLPVPDPAEIVPEDLLPHRRGVSVLAPVGQPGAFYGEGIIGFGAFNAVLGDIRLYKLGDKPRFHIHFRHEGLDGGLYLQAGEGYQRRLGSIEGDWTGEIGPLLVEGTASYREKESGLQQNSPFTSSLWRATSGDLAAVLPLSEQFSFGMSATGLYATRTLSGPDPDSRMEAVLRPRLSLDLTMDPVTAFLAVGYRLRSSSYQELPLHAFWAGIGLDVELEQGPAFGARVSADFSRDVWVFPFELSFSAALGERFFFKLFGGFMQEENLLYDQWSTAPFAVVLADPGAWRGWSAGGDVELGLGDVTYRGDLRFALVESTMVARGSRDAASGLYLLSPDAERWRVSGRQALSFLPREWLSASAAWNFMFQEGEPEEAIQMAPYVSHHSIDVSMEARSTPEQISAVLKAGFPLAPRFELPVVSLEGTLRLADGVSTSLQLSDILSPVLEEGRSEMGIFRARGFGLLASLTISL